jgi:hypothetical protein
MLTASRLRKVLNHDPATGVFRWRVDRLPSVMVGDIAGCIRPPKGYRVICVGGTIFHANRLAWLYMTGKWPKLEISYINRNTSDIRWANLREMTPSQRGAWSRRRNKLSAKGIWITKQGKYVAQLPLWPMRTHQILSRTSLTTASTDDVVQCQTLWTHVEPT